MKKLVKCGFTLTVVAILLSGCSTADVQTLVGGGEAISTSTVKHAVTNPSHVKLYYSSADVPKHYQSVGRVSANNDNMMGIPHSQQTISAELKKQAALLGANGVINISNGLEQTTGEAILAKL